MSTGWRVQRPSWPDTRLSLLSLKNVFLAPALILFASGALFAQHQSLRIGDARIDRVTGSAKAIYRPRFDKPKTGPPDEVVREYLEFDKRIGWKGDSSSLRLIDQVTSRGGTHLTYQQYVDGIPVIDAVTKVSINIDLEPTFVMNGFEPALLNDIEFHPEIDRSAAEHTAAEAVKGGDAAVKPAILAILPGDPARLVWQSTVWPETGGEWRVLVDALSGVVVRVEERTLHRSSHSRLQKPGRLVRRIEPSSPPITSAATSKAQATGKGMVFDPDPLATSGMAYAPPYADSEDAEVPELNAERIAVELLDIGLFADNQYRLAGPYVEVVGRRASGLSNYDPPAERDPEQFNYTRGDERFEAVMVYYHIDKSQRWVQEMGFDNIQSLPIPVNPFGEGGIDNSNYYPSLNYIGFGSGGIDDAEDAYVIWHEYAHALLNANVPNLLSTFEGRSIHEGWADYWAASYQREMFEVGELPDGDWRRLFRWDGNNPGNNPPWTGRRLPEFARYPDDLNTSSRHLDGLVWASALMGVWDLLGRGLTDQLNLQSHFYLTGGATMADMAEAFIQADIDLYNGEHASQIVAVFADRGFVDAESFGPAIVHEPVGDTEQIGGSVDIVAMVTGIISPIESVSLTYSIGSEKSVTEMSPTGDGSYLSRISLPASPAVVEYYIVALDGQGTEVRFPDDAPVTVVRFLSGPDNEGPSIDHSPITQISVFGWPPVVNATITDNIGVDSAFVEYIIDNVDLGTRIDAGRFFLDREGDFYSGSFPELEGRIFGNEMVSYRLIARDRASSANETALPRTDSAAFEFPVSPLGTVAFFDFESSGEVSTNGVWEHGTPAFGVNYAHSGSGAWATRLDRSYPDFPGTAELVLPAIDLSGLTSAWLEFWHWYDMEHDGSALPGSGTNAILWDGGVVQVSTDGGSSWMPVTPEGGYSGTISIGGGNPLEGEPAFGGYSFGWRREVVLIPAGPDVRVRFVFGQDVSNDEESIAYAGWVIDDVSIRVDKPSDVEAPVVLEEPPAESEAEAGSSFGPFVALRVIDDVGVNSVDVSYELSGPAGSASGSIRLAQSATESDTFEGTIPIDAAATAPGSTVTYDVRITDFGGNKVEIPSSGAPYRVTYVFVARENKLVGITPSGGWESIDDGWLVSSRSYSAGTAALVLSPIDLPTDAADVRFEMVHDYHLAPSARAEVRASTDGGRTWTPIEPENGYPGTDTGFEGTVNGVRSVFSLQSFAGGQVQLRIELEAAQSLTQDDFWRILSASAVFKAEDDRFTIPRSLELHPNFPDPFGQVTTISYTIPEPTVVDLAVYDVLGRRVAQIVNEPMEPGTYTTRWNANGLASGTYFLSLQTKSGQAVEAISIINQ